MRFIAKENMEYRFFVLVQLNMEQKERQVRNPVVETWKFMKKVREGFAETAQNISGMNVTDILEEEIENYLEVEDVLFSQVRGPFIIQDVRNRLQRAFYSIITLNVA